MDAPRRCSDCGAPLPSGAAAGLCPRCVVLKVAPATESVVLPPRPAAKAPPKQPSAEEFLKAVRGLGLADEASIAGWAASREDAPKLARTLVREGKLTAYQAAAILQGKTRGLLIGDHLVFDKIGRGGMGVVFRARKRRGGSDVALKILPPSFARDAEAVVRFRREYEIAARLKHPNIVSALEASEDRGVQFLTMEFIPGHNLDQVVREVGPLPLALGLHCAIQAGRGLEAAHAAGIVHRDVKPGNLMLDASGQVRLLDLGLARVLESAAAFYRKSNASLTQTGMTMGTVDFMSPEQANDSSRADHRADVYSLGCTLYFLLAGRAPFPDGSPLQKLFAHQTQPLPALGSVRHGIPPALEALYQRMTAREPDARPQSMTEVVAALEACRDSPRESDDARETLRSMGESFRSRSAAAPTLDQEPSTLPTISPPKGTAEAAVVRIEELIPDLGLDEPIAPPPKPPVSVRLWRGDVPSSSPRHATLFAAGGVGLLGLIVLGYALRPDESARTEPVAPREAAEEPQPRAVVSSMPRRVEPEDEEPARPTPAVERELTPREAVLARLDEPIVVDFKGETLTQVLRFLENASVGPRLPGGVPFFVDPVELKAAGTTVEAPVHFSADRAPLKQALADLLKPLRLSYAVDGAIVKLTSLAAPPPKPPAEKAPEKSVIYADEFDNPATGWPRNSPDDLHCYHDYAPGGTYFIEARHSGQWAWSNDKVNLPGYVYEVTASVLGVGESQGAWCLILLCDNNRSVQIQIDRAGRLSVLPSFWNEKKYADDVYLGPISLPAIKAGREKNTMTLRVMKRELEIKVNGKRVCPPIPFRFDLAPSQPQIGLISDDGQIKAVFDRLEIRKLDP